MLRRLYTQFLVEQSDLHLKKESKGAKATPKQIIEAQTLYEPSNWLNKILADARYGAATHVSTYTHPSAKTSCIIVDQDIQPNGMLLTQNVVCSHKFDVFGNAKYDSLVYEAYKFLSLKDSNNKSIIEHLEQDTAEIQELAESFSVDYAYFKDRLSKFQPTSNPSETHYLVKQVYFPIADGEYHILSLLTSSVVQIELLQRINEIKFSESNKVARECKKINSYTEHEFKEVYGITEVYYGGSQPQNVSILNAKKSGVAYLLNSLPPKLNKQYKRLPTNDFFKTLPLYEFRNAFDHFSQLLNTGYNNKNIRNGLVTCIEIISDQIISHVLNIYFSSPEGWTSENQYSSLPKDQKILLDQQYDKSERNDDWSKNIVQEMTLWIINKYEYLNKKGRMLTSSEIDYISNICNSNLVKFKRIA